MSHFTKLKTKLADKDYLLRALESLNIVYRIGPETIVSFYDENIKADIVIPTKITKYSIGLVWNGNSYELVGDWFFIDEITPDILLRKITQRYSYLAVIDKLAEQGFVIAEQTVDANEQIHITLRG